MCIYRFYVYRFLNMTDYGNKIMFLRQVPLYILYDNYSEMLNWKFNYYNRNAFFFQIPRISLVLLKMHSDR